MSNNYGSLDVSSKRAALMGLTRGGKLEPSPIIPLYRALALGIISKETTSSMSVSAYDHLNELTGQISGQMLQVAGSKSVTDFGESVDHPQVIA
jgi:hypothetical protein